MGRKRIRAPSTAASRQGESLLVADLGVLDDEDGVLAGQADQHHQSDLGVDVVVQPAQPLCEQRPEHGFAASVCPTNSP